MSLGEATLSSQAYWNTAVKCKFSGIEHAVIDGENTCHLPHVLDDHPPKDPTSSTNLSDITSQCSIHIYHIWLCQEVSCSATNVPGTIAIKGVHHWIRKGWRNGRLRLAKVSSASSMESNIIVYVKNSRNVDRNKNHSTCSSCFLFNLNIKIKKNNHSPILFAAAWFPL